MDDLWYMTVATVADMWKRPAFESERVNQTLYGEFVRRDIKQGKYLKVFTDDSYTGWIRQDHLVPVVDTMSDLKSARVRSIFAELYRSEKSRTLSGRLPFGARVIFDIAAQKRDEQSSRIKLEYPKGWIESGDLLLRRADQIALTTVIRTFKKFTGTPYLWGGRSSYGCDCSGFIQLVFGYYGLELPRDSKDQRQCGKAVSRKRLDLCDLIFSPGHVSVHIGRGEIVHASQKTGSVAVESIDPDSNRYRADIAEKINAIRRIV
jgi:gamma-D-glutamyl-L-lysine dipeptidyl-peptidase